MDWYSKEKVAVNLWATIQVLGSQDVPTHHPFCSSSGGERTQEQVETGISLSICAWHPVRRAPASLQHWKTGTTKAHPPLTHCWPCLRQLSLPSPPQDSPERWHRISEIELWSQEFPVRSTSSLGTTEGVLEIKTSILLIQISDLQLGKVKSLSFPQSISHGQSRQFSKVF